jgi:hypothetical protein
MTRRARILLATLLAASGTAGFLSSSYEEDLRRMRHASSFGTLIAAIAAVPIEYAQEWNWNSAAVYSWRGRKDLTRDLPTLSTWCVRDTRFRYLRTSSPDRFWNSHSDRRNAQED